MRQAIKTKWDGKRFGKIVVVGFFGKRNAHGQMIVTCVCDCGTVFDRSTSHIKRDINRDSYQSCGKCDTPDSERHGEGHGKSRTPEYRAWAGMIDRCHCESNKRWNDYGGRGITVCNEWRNSYRAFLDHVGRRPSKTHSLDRIKNNGNYEPGNVRWATRSEQQKNQRKVGDIDWIATDKLIAELARRGYTVSPTVGEAEKKFGKSC